MLTGQERLLLNAITNSDSITTILLLIREALDSCGLCGLVCMWRRVGVFLLVRGFEMNNLEETGLKTTHLLQDRHSLCISKRL